MKKINELIEFINNNEDIYISPKYTVTEFKDKNVIHSTVIKQFIIEIEDGILYSADLHNNLLKNNMVLANIFIDDIESVKILEKEADVSLYNGYIIKIELE